MAGQGAIIEGFQGLTPSPVGHYPVSISDVHPQYGIITKTGMVDMGSQEDESSDLWEKYSKGRINQAG
jgi:hypothetical protein